MQVQVDINIKSPKGKYQNLPVPKQSLYKDYLKFAIIEEEIDLEKAQSILEEFVTKSECHETNIIRNAICTGKYLKNEHATTVFDDALVK